MSKIKKILICALVILSTLSLTINFSNSQQSSSPIIHTSNGDWESFTGSYDGDLSIMYFRDNWTFTDLIDANSSTSIISPNMTVPGYNYEYKIKSLDIRANNLINYSLPERFTIAENISNQVNLTSAYAFAQEFTAPALMQMNEIMVYINYSLPFVPPGFYYYLDVFIYDKFLNEQIESLWGSYETRGTVDEWFSYIANPYIYRPGEQYNMVFKIWFNGSYDNPFNFCKAENYTNPSFNKGTTRRYNGVFWTTIPNDSTADILCNFSYTKVIHPAQVDLKFIINNDTVRPIYILSPWGFESFYSYTFNTEITQSINITISTNQTVSNLNVNIEMYYYYLINASGTYTADENLLKWTINYPYEDVSFGWPPPVFLYENDWDFEEFRNPNQVEMTQIYFGPIDLYNDSYYGITVFFGPPLQEGNYTGIFYSRNYCKDIKTMVESGNDFVEKSLLQIGQTFKLEGEISNSINEPITGGIGQIALFSSSGELIHNETGLTAINGIMSSSEIELDSNLGAGNYEARIFWTNGKEIAFYSINIQVEDPGQIVLFIVIGLIAAVASTPVALVLRRQIRQRNWEKSLKNLFVLTHDGLSLYEYSFGIEIQDSALISAMIAALTNFVREATGSKKALRTVDQEDKKVMLYHGKYTTVALLSEKDLPIIHKRIMKFAEAFEGNYGKLLKTWKGETTLFKGTEILVNKYFPIDVESQVIHGVRQKLIEFREKLENLIYPKDIISFMRTITDFISRYRVIVTKYYLDYYNEIIITAEEKISSA